MPQRIYERNIDWEKTHVASELLFWCHKSNIHTASERPLAECHVYRNVCCEKNVGIKEQALKWSNQQPQGPHHLLLDLQQNRWQGITVSYVKKIMTSVSSPYKLKTRGRQLDELWKFPKIQYRWQDQAMHSLTKWCPAIDVRYHKPCWTWHVFHVLRDDASKKWEAKKSAMTQTSSFLDFWCSQSLIWHKLWIIWTWKHRISI